MRTTETTAARRVIEIDEALLHRTLWVLAAAGLAAALLTSDPTVLAVVAGAALVSLGAMSHFDSEVRRDLRVPIEAAWTATIAAVTAQGLLYDAARSRRGVTENRIAAGDATVRLESHPGGVTRVRVRVGWFGLPDDRRRAALVAERIVADLDAFRWAT